MEGGDRNKKGDCDKERLGPKVGGEERMTVFFWDEVMRTSMGKKEGKGRKGGCNVPYQPFHLFASPKCATSAPHFLSSHGPCYSCCSPANERHSCVHPYNSVPLLCFVPLL